MPSEVVQPQIARLRRSVRHWYDLNRRDLPWRRTRDPYRIWVSEIMLQQTRVAAVLEHYRRWFELFPNVKSLASANLDDVLAAWSGLGYYRRARMLHQAAKVVVTEMNGAMPRSSTELRKLQGIGRYTAAAIASIAFGEPTAVVDGNVERVLKRFAGRELAGEALWETAQNWLGPDHILSIPPYREKRDKGGATLESRVSSNVSSAAATTHACSPGDWNQAMMELGATVCTPVNPQCKECPLRNWCQGRLAAQNGEKSISESSSARKRKLVARALSQRIGRVYLVQRPADAKKMAGMWELPEAELEEDTDPLLKVRHSITDTDYQVHVYAQNVKRVPNGRWYSPAELGTLALTGLTRKVLRKLAILVG